MGANTGQHNGGEDNDSFALRFTVSETRGILLRPEYRIIAAAGTAAEGLIGCLWYASRRHRLRGSSWRRCWRPPARSQRRSSPFRSRRVRGAQGFNITFRGACSSVLNRARNQLAPNDFLYSVHGCTVSWPALDCRPRSPGAGSWKAFFHSFRRTSHISNWQAFNSVVNLFAWPLALLLLVIALRKNRIESLSVGPFSFRMMKEEAIVATATASRAWQSSSEEKVDVPRIRAMVDRVFTPVRALRKFGLDIEQAASSEAAMTAFQRRRFDLVISDMARGEDMRAGCGLLKSLGDSGSKVPFFIFAGSDTPEYRREAAKRGTCSSWSTTS